MTTTNLSPSAKDQFNSNSGTSKSPGAKLFLEQSAAVTLNGQIHTTNGLKIIPQKPSNGGGFTYPNGSSVPFYIVATDGSTSAPITVIWGTTHTYVVKMSDGSTVTVTCVRTGKNFTVSLQTSTELTTSISSVPGAQLQFFYARTKTWVPVDSALSAPAGYALQFRLLKGAVATPAVTYNWGANQNFTFNVSGSQIDAKFTHSGNTVHIDVVPHTVTLPGHTLLGNGTIVVTANKPSAGQDTITGTVPVTNGGSIWVYEGTAPTATTKGAGRWFKLTDGGAGDQATTYTAGGVTYHVKDGKVVYSMVRNSTQYFMVYRDPLSASEGPIQVAPPDGKGLPVTNDPHVVFPFVPFPVPPAAPPPGGAPGGTENNPNNKQTPKFGVDPLYLAGEAANVAVAPVGYALRNEILGLINSTLGSSLISSLAAVTGPSALSSLEGLGKIIAARLAGSADLASLLGEIVAGTGVAVTPLLALARLIAAVQGRSVAGTNGTPSSISFSLPFTSTDPGGGKTVGIKGQVNAGVVLYPKGGVVPDDQGTVGFAVNIGGLFCNFQWAANQASKTVNTGDTVGLSIHPFTIGGVKIPLNGVTALQAGGFTGMPLTFNFAISTHKPLNWSIGSMTGASAVFPAPPYAPPLLEPQDNIPAPLNPISHLPFLSAFHVVDSTTLKATVWNAPPPSQLKIKLHPTYPGVAYWKGAGGLVPVNTGLTTVSLGSNDTFTLYNAAKQQIGTLTITLAGKPNQTVTVTGLPGATATGAAAVNGVETITLGGSPPAANVKVHLKSTYPGVVYWKGAGAMVPVSTGVATVALGSSDTFTLFNAAKQQIGTLAITLAGKPNQTVVVSSLAGAIATASPLVSGQETITLSKASPQSVFLHPRINTTYAPNIVGVRVAGGTGAILPIHTLGTVSVPKGATATYNLYDVAQKIVSTLTIANAGTPQEKLTMSTPGSAAKGGPITAVPGTTDMLIQDISLWTPQPSVPPEPNLKGQAGLHIGMTPADLAAYGPITKVVALGPDGRTVSGQGPSGSITLNANIPPVYLEIWTQKYGLIKLQLQGIGTMNFSPNRTAYQTPFVTASSESVANQLYLTLGNPDSIAKQVGAVLQFYMPATEAGKSVTATYTDVHGVLHTNEVITDNSAIDEDHQLPNFIKLNAKAGSTATLTMHYTANGKPGLSVVRIDNIGMPNTSKTVLSGPQTWPAQPGFPIISYTAEQGTTVDFRGL